jgi:type II secretory pathway pseudopilin PulG
MATCAKCGGTFDEATGACPACLSGAVAAPAAAQPSKGSGTKVIIIVVLAVLGVLLLFCVGIIAAIAIPNFISAKGRAQQKRAESDVRSLATAVQSFQIDTNTYPDSHGQVVPVSEMAALCDEVTEAQSGKPSEFFTAYAPTMAKAQTDGTPYYFAGNGQHFLVIALGSDKKCDGDLDQTVGAWMAPWPEEGAPVQPRETPCFENDIVWADNDWLWVPGEKQRGCGDQGGHDGPPQFGETN